MIVTRIDYACIGFILLWVALRILCGIYRLINEGELNDQYLEVVLLLDKKLTNVAAMVKV